MAKPAVQFCCGCSLTFGVVFILTLNLIQNLFYIVTAVSNIILKIPIFRSDQSLTSQTFTAAFCLLGLPFILAGFWGALGKFENHLRLYLGYMVVSFLVDAADIAAYFIQEDIC